MSFRKGSMQTGLFGLDRSGARSARAIAIFQRNVPARSKAQDELLPAGPQEQDGESHQKRCTPTKQDYTMLLGGSLLYPLAGGPSTTRRSMLACAWTRGAWVGQSASCSTSQAMVSQGNPDSPLASS